MATEILRPRDVLASVPARVRRNYRRPQSNSDPKHKPPFRKSSPKPPPSADAAAAAAAVKIIKNRKTKMEELYAGSGFFVSPAPSSVPLPSFCVIRREPSSSDPAVVEFLQMIRSEVLADGRTIPKESSLLRIRGK